ncbi:PAP2-like haloperoxidase [Chondrus crispus]|uniref:PAP2-like haloperoxidase n=1 Tax=Chondrus crispus TaxID=2769 RepID=R7QTE4_CHOCR|nr:PAP2-like haloperoxidase [Chondrus crispus]CDF40781.1 PAP2-like haloperoxidase [Chondrus crispus]|eukprot:XP_005711075.1 PAP2-like haloperoxidase [Chondrus crispus]
MVLHVLAFIVLLFSHCVNAQAPEEPTLLQNLTIDFTPLNEYANVLFPVDVVSMETPIAIRYVLVFTIPFYEVFAACDSKALGFLGKRNVILPHLCEPLSIAKTTAFLMSRLYRSQFPLEGRNLEAFLIRQGLDPTSDSTDPTTEIGIANAMAVDLVAYLETDGWNSLGDLSRDHFRQQYSDYTGFKPQNHAELDVSRLRRPLRWQLRRPLRWQPLKQEADRRGRFTSQVHVVPHIGRAKPLVLSREEFLSRTSESPYASADRKKTIGAKDKRTMRRLLREVLKLNRDLTKEQIAQAHWWDNKFLSLGSFITFYQGVYGFNNADAAVLGLGEVMAQHDSVMLAWKEKLRHDLVRPPTMLRRLFEGKKIRAFKSLDEGVGLVRAEEWEPIVPIQPHSEYPSASALICQASLDHLHAALTNFIKVNGTIAAYETDIVPFLRSPLTENVKVKYETLQAAALTCGKSRLYAGVHFSPSVDVGFKLGQGIGAVAQKHIQDLWEGRIPENCERCSNV